MNTETVQTEGGLRELAGEAQEAAGDMLGDAGTRLAGNERALRGKSQKLAADAALVTREAIAGNLLATLGLAIGIGFALGAWWAANRE
jgi:uncharacterized protein YjbJ (UPF0337 family)